ncbi:helix-turn-helix domain-containing protein [Arthrobacter sp. MDT2-16]
MWCGSVSTLLRRVRASISGAAFGGWDAGYMTDQPHDDEQHDGQARPLRFFTLQQVADELNTKHGTVRALIASGELPAIQIGGRGQWRIEPCQDRGLCHRGLCQGPLRYCPR